MTHQMVFGIRQSRSFLSVLKYDIMMHHALVTIKCKQILRAMGAILPTPVNYPVVNNQ
jgi:hypothetical protein